MYKYLRVVSVVILACCALRCSAGDLRWTFDHPSPSGFVSEDGRTVLTPLRHYTLAPGIDKQAVNLTRADTLRVANIADPLGSGPFTIQFWVKVGWASREYDQGDILNFITDDQAKPWLWRVGFPDDKHRIKPREHWPLVLTIGKYNTAEVPVLIEPWHWTHVAFVSNGHGVDVYRNGSLIGSVWGSDEGLGLSAAQRGDLQVNGSAYLYRKSWPTVAWECDMKLDDLTISDKAIAPTIKFPEALREKELQSADPAIVLPAKNLHSDMHPGGSPPGVADDYFVLQTLRKQAHQYDGAADTRAEAQHAVKLLAQATKSVAAGQSALADSRGHLCLSYWSRYDESEQPYEVYVPKSYQGSRPVPLVIYLHGSGEGETGFFYRYSAARLAEKYGWIIAVPLVRGNGAYTDEGERDVLDVLAQVKHQWKIDPKRIYIFGHSMGGGGAIVMAANHSDIFAAASSIANGMAAPGFQACAEKLRHMPFLWVFGDKDYVDTVAMAEAKKWGSPHEQLIMAGFNHGGVNMAQWPPLVEASLGNVFSFFANKHLR